MSTLKPLDRFEFILCIEPIFPIIWMELILDIEPFFYKNLFFLWSNFSFLLLPMFRGNGLLGCWIGVRMSRLLMGLRSGNGLLSANMTLSSRSDLALSESMLSLKPRLKVAILGTLSFSSSSSLLGGLIYYLLMFIVRLFSSLEFSMLLVKFMSLEANSVGISIFSYYPLSIFFFFSSICWSKSSIYLFRVE